MNTADKLMNIAIDGDPGEEVVVEREGADAQDDDELVEETTLTRSVRRRRPPENRVIIVED